MSTRSERCSRRRLHEDQPDPSPERDLLCRICMHGKSKSQLVGLFGRRIKGECLAQILSLVGSVEVREHDRLPSQCCTKCAKELKAAFKLRNRCQESDRKLRERFVVPVDGGDDEEDEMVVKLELPEDGAEAVNPMDVEYITCHSDVFVATTAAPEVSEVEEGGKNDSGGIKSEEPKPEESGVKSEPASGNDGDSSDSSADDNDCNDDVKDEEDDDNESVEDYRPPRPAATKKRSKTAKTNGKGEFPDVFEEVPPVTFFCCGCRKRFPTPEELQEHSEEVHQVKKLQQSQLKGRRQCEICYKTLRDSYAYDLHREIGRYNYRCKTCGDVFFSRKRVCSHHEIVHGQHPVLTSAIRICCGCAQNFDTLEALMEHSATVHLPNKQPPDEKKRFACEICYRCFTTEQILHNHRSRLLNGGKKKTHQCVHCGKTFISPSVLKDHEQSHDGKKIFQCTECPRAYTNKDAFRKHVVIHKQPEDKYKCQICDKCFKRKDTFDEHMLVHTGERPLECPYCPAKFARKGCRISHIRTHTGKKDFPCPQCDKRFPCSSDRNRHLNYFHHKARPFACFFCPNRYPRKDYRRKHMESAHPAELAANLVPAIELSGGNRWTYAAPQLLPPPPGPVEPVKPEQQEQN